MDVKAMRGKLGLSQQEFADLIDVPVSTLRGWEQGRRHPDRASRTLIRLAAQRPDLFDFALRDNQLPGWLRIESAITKRTSSTHDQGYDPRNLPIDSTPN